MIARGYKRIPVALDAELVSSNVNYPAFIENISEDGIYAKIAYTETTKNLNLETSIHLRFQAHSGEMLNLMCRKKWAERNTKNLFPLSLLSKATSARRRENTAYAMLL
jgi:hypothetical protein